MEMTIGKYIEQLRIEKKLSQRGLATLAGLTNTTINRIESDSVVPDLTTIEKLAIALEIDIATLLRVSGFLDIPENFIVMARKAGELSDIDRAKLFHNLNDTVEDFLQSLNDEEEYLEN